MKVLLAKIFVVGAIGVVTTVITAIATEKPAVALGTGCASCAAAASKIR